MAPRIDSRRKWSNRWTQFLYVWACMWSEEHAAPVRDEVWIGRDPRRWWVQMRWSMAWACFEVVEPICQLVELVFCRERGQWISLHSHVLVTSSYALLEKSLENMAFFNDGKDDHKHFNDQISPTVHEYLSVELAKDVSH